jgi:glycosyltransferase involved in cell wall biosynthesis
MIKVAIDASRNRSGGAKAHLVGILNACDPRNYGIKEIHVWSYGDLLLKLPEKSWLIKHSPEELNGSLIRQIWWQYKKFPNEIYDNRCDVLLSTDAGTICSFKPDVVMSRDMLSFEVGEMDRYSFLSLSRLRLLALKWIQIRSLRNANAALFLTEYASNKIQSHTGTLAFSRVIHHGIGEEFRRIAIAPICNDNNRIINCTYVSNADLYKHQWNVIEAIFLLRNSGFNITINLVGGGSGFAADKVLETANHFDPDRLFVNIQKSRNHDDIPDILFDSDIFIFASSCENMPNTLVEAMASGLPIACSNRGPMPEILGDAGVYFDPEDAYSIFIAVKKILENESLRKYISDRAISKSNFFSWKRCAVETWKLLVDVNSTKNHPTI